MLKYPCLVLDHDDTVVQSEATVNYPYFCHFLDRIRPGAKISAEEYTLGCYAKDFVQMCKEKYNFTQEEQEAEYRGWKEYVQTHIADPFPGIKEVIMHQKAAGGLVCVVSQSTEETIRRHYLTHFGILPDLIYARDLPPEQRKPAPYPLMDIMKKYNLSPSELLVIDDMKQGCEMARKVGSPVAFAAWGRQNYPDILNDMSALCDYTFHSVNQLNRFLFEE